MLPASFVRLRRLPLTANGKLDLSALPAPDLAPAKRDGRPETTLHIQLIELWQGVLGRSPIGVHDDFFELGGHSLLAAKMLASIESRVGRRVPFRCFSSARQSRTWRITLWRNKCALRATTQWSRSSLAVQRLRCFFLHGDFSGGGFYCRSLAHLLGNERPFHAFTRTVCTARKSRGNIEEMAADRLAAVRRIQPVGPYCSEVFAMAP
jgi:hypothetical protein